MKNKKNIIRSIIVLLLLIFGLTNCEKSKCQEHLDKDCICLTIYEPVCGCNNKTYSNACVAKCSGITEFTAGECQ